MSNEQQKKNKNPENKSNSNNKKSSSSYVKKLSNLAVLIDADNVTSFVVEELFFVSRKIGTDTVRRAYADWRSEHLPGWDHACLRNGIDPIQQFAYRKGKNSSDIRLVIDAMELSFSDNVDGFLIASSDSDFTPLVLNLRQRGFPVYGFGRSTTHHAFRAACNYFYAYDYLASFKEKIDKPHAYSPIEEVRLIEVKEWEEIQARQEQWKKKQQSEEDQTVTTSDIDDTEEVNEEDEPLNIASETDLNLSPENAPVPAIENVSAPSEEAPKKDTPTTADNTKAQPQNKQDPAKKMATSKRVYSWVQWLQQFVPEEQLPVVLESSPAPPEHQNLDLSTKEKEELEKIRPIFYEIIRKHADNQGWAPERLIKPEIESSIPEFSPTNYRCKYFSVVVCALDDICVGYREQKRPEQWQENQSFPQAWARYYRIVEREKLITFINNAIEKCKDDTGWAKVDELPNHYRFNPLNFGFQDQWDLLCWLGYEVKIDYENGDKTRTLKRETKRRAESKENSQLSRPAQSVEARKSPAAEKPRVAEKEKSVEEKRESRPAQLAETRKSPVAEKSRVAEKEKSVEEKQESHPAQLAETRQPPAAEKPRVAEKEKSVEEKQESRPAQLAETRQPPAEPEILTAKEENPATQENETHPAAQSVESGKSSVEPELFVAKEESPTAQEKEKSVEEKQESRPAQLAETRQPPAEPEILTAKEESPIAQENETYPAAQSVESGKSSVEPELFVAEESPTAQETESQNDYSTDVLIFAEDSHDSEFLVNSFHHPEDNPDSNEMEEEASDILEKLAAQQHFAAEDFIAASDKLSLLALETDNVQDKLSIEDSSFAADLLAMSEELKAIGKNIHENPEEYNTSAAEMVYRITLGKWAKETAETQRKVAAERDSFAQLLAEENTTKDKVEGSSSDLTSTLQETEEHFIEVFPDEPKEALENQKMIYSWREFYPEEDLDTVGPVFPTYYESYCNKEFDEEKLETLKSAIYDAIYFNDLGNGWAAMSSIEQDLKYRDSNFKPENYDCLNMYYLLSMINNLCPGYERDMETEDMIPTEKEIYFRIIHRNHLMKKINHFICECDKNAWILTNIIKNSVDINPLKIGFKDFDELLVWLGYEIKKDIQGNNRTRIKEIEDADTIPDFTEYPQPRLLMVNLLKNSEESTNQVDDEVEALEKEDIGAQDLYYDEEKQADESQPIDIDLDFYLAEELPFQEENTTLIQIAEKTISDGLEIMPMSHFYPPNSFVHQKFYLNAVEDSLPVPNYNHENLPEFLRIKPIIYAIIQAVSNHEGWALLKDIENCLQKNVPDFKPDNYGFPNMMSMLKIIGDICLGYDKNQFRDLRAEYGYTPFNKLKHYYMIIPYGNLLQSIREGINHYKNSEGWADISQLEEYIKPIFNFNYYGFYYFSDLLNSILILETKNNFVRIKPENC